MAPAASRREFLEVSGVVFSLFLSGCSDRGDGTPDADPNIEVVKRLGGATPVAIEVEPQREYEYLEEDDRVRIHYESGESSTRRFDEWGTMRAADHAADRIKSLLDAESLLVDGVTVGWGKLELREVDEADGDSNPSEDEFSRDADFGPFVSHVHTYDSDGDLVHRPDVSFESVVGATPRAVDVTVLFRECEYTALLPVLCERTWEKAV